MRCDVCGSDFAVARVNATKVETELLDEFGEIVGRARAISRTQARIVCAKCPSPVSESQVSSGNVSGGQPAKP